MRPCRFCQGRHMDVLCPRNKPVAPPQQAAAHAPAAAKAAGKGAPSKAGGRGAGAGPNFYAGYCYKCGKWGHRSTTCRVVMGIFDEVLTENQKIASLYDAAGELKVPRLLLVHSG
eukprot:8832416-Heterocapsa_arctica.AAC.1